VRAAGRGEEGREQWGKARTEADAPSASASDHPLESQAERSSFFFKGGAGQRAVLPPAPKSSRRAAAIRPGGCHSQIRLRSASFAQVSFKTLTAIGFRGKSEGKKRIFSGIWADGRTRSTSTFLHSQSLTARSIRRQEKAPPEGTGRPPAVSACAISIYQHDRILDGLFVTPKRSAAVEAAGIHQTMGRGTDFFFF